MRTSLIAILAISTDAALEVARGALAHCRKEGQKVSVTVVDSAGRAKVSLRDDGAAPSRERPEARVAASTTRKCAEAGIERIAKDLAAAR